MTCMLTDRNQAKQNKFPFDKGQNNCFTKCSLHFIYNLFKFLLSDKNLVKNMANRKCSLVFIYSCLLKHVVYHT